MDTERASLGGLGHSSQPGQRPESAAFIGGKVESFAAEWIGKYLAKEQKVGAQWLADHGSSA